MKLWINKWVLTEKFDDHGERHNEQRHKQIGDRQRHEEVVGDVLQPWFQTDGQADEQVSGGRGPNDGAQTESAPPQPGAFVVAGGRRLVARRQPRRRH